jgi:hypothetical protein
MIPYIQGVSPFGRGAGKREIPKKETKKRESIDIRMNIK